MGGGFSREKKGSGGALGGGCVLWLVVLVFWGVCALIFPKLPGYDETLEDGERVPGVVVRVESVENLTINDRHPQRIVYRYGDGQEASMTMALDESVTEGQSIKVRLMGEHAYPEAVRPLAKPEWLNFVLIAGAILGSLLLAVGVLRLLLVGGLLFAGARAMLKEKDEPQPPPSGPPPPPR